MTIHVDQGIFIRSYSLCHFIGLVSGTHDKPVTELPLKDGNLPVCVEGCYRILIEKIRETGKSVLWSQYTSRELVHILKKNDTADGVGDRCYYTETVEGEHDWELIEVPLKDGSFPICKRCYRRFRVKVSMGNKTPRKDGDPVVNLRKFTSDDVRAVLQSIRSHKKRKNEEEEPATAEAASSSGVSSDLIAKSDEKNDELDTGAFCDDLVKGLQDGSIFAEDSWMIQGVHVPQSSGISDEKKDDLDTGIVLNDLIKDLD